MCRTLCACHTHIRLVQPMGEGPGRPDDPPPPPPTHTMDQWLELSMAGTFSRSIPTIDPHTHTHTVSTDTVTLIHGVQKTLTVQASSALARAPQKAVVTNCIVCAGAVVSTPVYHPHTLLTSYCMFLPALFETKQQLKGTGRMSAMRCSPVSLQVVQ